MSGSRYPQEPLSAGTARPLASSRISLVGRPPGRAAGPVGLGLQTLAQHARCGSRGTSDIRVYTEPVKVVKVRRVGNSNVVSIPRELEGRGFVPGTPVLVEELENGELRIMRTDQVHDRIREIAHRVVGEHDEALKILAEDDPGSEPVGQ